ncbi:MAG: S8 family serine peptidase [Succinivibrionaceae bacterium]
MNKFFKVSLISSAMIFALSSIVGCGGSDNNNSKPSNDIEFTTETKDVFSGEYLTIKAKDSVVNIEALHGTVSKELPTKLSESENTDNIWYYTINTKYFDNINNKLEEEFTLTYDDGSIETFTKSFEDQVSDPLMRYQWHLKNTGLNPFKTGIDPTSGIDLNVDEAWKLGLSGKDVVVTVFDDPVDFLHEDLKDRKYNISSGEGINDDVIKQLRTTEDLHGTMVSGIILASKNNKGVRGISYDSKMISLNSSKYDTNDTDGTDFFNDNLNKYNIVNASIGIDLITTESPQWTNIFDLMFDNDKPIIKAMGNEFRDCIYNDLSKPLSSCDCLSIGVDCEYKMTSSLDRYPYNINVGAINSRGIKSSYSSSGTHIWVAGFGGEYGYDDSSTDSPAIVTTFSSLNKKELDKISEEIDWDNETPWRENIKDYYTAKMNGTSAATPTVTGVSALVIQAKPDITVPQLRYILAKTARNDDVWNSLEYQPKTLTHKPTKTTDLRVEKGWEDLDNGLRFSHYYGFGVVDASEAVKLAKGCDKDTECSIYNELPTVYKSTNEQPCKYKEGSDNKIVTCTFSDFADEDAEKLASNSYMIDSVSVDLQKLKYASTTQNNAFGSTNDACKNLDKKTTNLYEANHNLHIEMNASFDEGNKEITAIIKPYLSNWDYTGDAKDSLYVNTNNFYRQIIDNDNPTFNMTIYTSCPLDLDSLNGLSKDDKTKSPINVMLYGYDLN